MIEKKEAHRILAIDYGLKRIGLAISDEMMMIALSLKTVLAEKKVEKTASKIAREIESLKQHYNCQIDEIVVGLPLLMNGKVGFLADEVKYFVQLLGKLVTIPIITWDERLTSVQAQRSIKEGGASRKKQAQVVDSVAAIIILQSYLDNRQNKLEQTLIE
jgi:putative Holliday junction resolvase